MRARRLLSAALSTRRRKARALLAVTVAATAAAVAPLIVVTTAAASAENTAAITPTQVHVDLTAPETVTDGVGTTLFARLTVAGVAVPNRQVTFVERPPGTPQWQLLATATTGLDGTTTIPVSPVTSVTEYGAYYSEAADTVRSTTSAAVVHVIDVHPAAPAVVAAGAKVTVAARLVEDATSALPGQRVQVRFRPAGQAWGPVHWTRTNSAGVVRLAARFAHTFQVGVRFPGAGLLAPSPFRTATVRVKQPGATTRAGFRFPFLDPGQVQSPGSWTLDQGVDMFANGEACGAAAKLVAVGNGTVIQTGISGFGPTAPVIRMSSGPFAGRNVYYGHTGHIYVHVGQQVHIGQLVAQIGCGDVGYSSGPHLEIGVSEPGGPPCCPPFHATATQMYHQLLAALRRS